MISGGDLPHSVRLSALDADSFTRRINLPPKMDEAPDVSGSRYLVTSPYWATAVHENDDGALAEDTAVAQ